MKTLEILVNHHSYQTADVVKAIDAAVATIDHCSDSLLIRMYDIFQGVKWDWEYVTKYAHDGNNPGVKATFAIDKLAVKARERGISESDLYRGAISIASTIAFTQASKAVRV